MGFTEKKEHKSTITHLSRNLERIAWIHCAGARALYRHWSTLVEEGRISLPSEYSDALETTHRNSHVPLFGFLIQQPNFATRSGETKVTMQRTVYHLTTKKILT